MKASERWKRSARRSSARVEQFLDRIADTDVPSIVATYEKRIRDLEAQKIILAERIENCGRALPDFDDALKTPLDFLRNPGNLWDSPRLEDKRAVLKLAFAGRLGYTRNEGFKTPDPSLPFKVLADFRGGKSKMARPRRETSNSLLDVLADWNAYLEQQQSSSLLVSD